MSDSHKNQLCLASRRGAAYLLALTTLVVGVVFALALLRAAGGHSTMQESLRRKQAAVNLAEAGLDYSYWHLNYKDPVLPDTEDVALSTGSFHVVATDDGARQASTTLITSTGTCGSQQYTAKRVVVSLPYNYAWYQNQSLSSTRRVISTGPAPGMRVNGSIQLTNNGTNITAGAWATSTITTTGTVTPQFPGSPPVWFPDIDYAYYNSIATQVYAGNQTFTNLTPVQAGVIVVDGGVTMNGGTYDGCFTIVATGLIDIKKDVARGNPSSFLALISATQIIIEASAKSVDALLYSHNATNTGEVYSRGGASKTLTGSMAADNIQVDGDFTANRDPSVTLDIVRHLHLPGVQ
jgi:Tfp pilus assembly protein PilX